MNKNMFKKICHLTSVHPRNDGRIFYKECISLKNIGWNVSLIVWDGKDNSIVDGVNIVNVGKVFKSKALRLILSPFLLYYSAIRQKCDLYHFHDPELILTGLLLKCSGKKVVYDIHEDLKQQILLKQWIPRPIRKLISKVFEIIEVTSSKYFDALVVPQPSMAKMYVNNVNRNTIQVANFVNISRLTAPKVKLSTANYVTLFHGGALTKDRGLINMLELAALCQNKLKLILAGPIFDEKLKTMLLNKRYENVHYRGLITQDEVDKIYDETDIGIILYNNVGQYYLSYAIKLFEYMAKGIPTIMPDFGEWPEFNKKYKCGVCVDVSNPQQILKAIKELVDDENYYMKLSRNGILAIKEQFNWELEVTKLDSLYQRILNEN